jgi:hypothetical protein
MFILIARLFLSTSLCTHAVKSGDILFGVNVGYAKIMLCCEYDKENIGIFNLIFWCTYYLQLNTYLITTDGLSYWDCSHEYVRKREKIPAFTENIS